MSSVLVDYLPKPVDELDAQGSNWQGAGDKPCIRVRGMPELNNIVVPRSSDEHKFVDERHQNLQHRAAGDAKRKRAARGKWRRETSRRLIAVVCSTDALK